MNRTLLVHETHPGITVQDLGRPGFLAFGLSRGGAADRLAIFEGAALLRQPDTKAALEMAGRGGVFEARVDMRIALTGAPMRANLDGSAIGWGASHLLPKGSRLTIGAATVGTYGYLHVGGGIETRALLGSFSDHQSAGLGDPIRSGEELPVGDDVASEVGWKLETRARFNGGTVRIVPSLQTDFFDRSQINRFEATTFRRDIRGNRMGVRLHQEGQAYESAAGLRVISEVIVPGDIQITGDGTPFVLLTECQTTGGYPRIGSVLPSELPIVAQAQPNTELRFEFVSLEQAVAIESADRDRQRSLRNNISQLIRDPREMRDLLSVNLISGVTAGDAQSGD